MTATRQGKKGAKKVGRPARARRPGRTPEPGLGAWLEGGRARFRVWAPERARVELALEPGRAGSRSVALEKQDDGYFEAAIDAAAGTRYAYRLDGDGPFPDPAARFLPDGVHGPAEIVDPNAFAWSDAGWRGVALADLSIYETHVGTFTPEGTFAGVERRLPHLRDLGITAVELMPVADFAGARNWGYDGVAPFAPSRAYGTPDDLRRLVDAAHRLGLAVLLDVVYNHFGPSGAYFAQFSPYYFSSTHQTPWGQAINLDGPHAEHVRAYFIANALHWIHEYHLDGLRLDATHALIDESPTHFLAELTARVEASVRGRTVLLIAEDDRNLAVMVHPRADGGWGLDAVWADDFHHHMRRLTAGDTDGYFQDFSGSTADVAATIERGWFFVGQHSAYRDGPRGTDPAGVPRERMVVALQNHDQIGNRAFGDRLHHRIDLAVFRAASALLLFGPETPLLFMGQEWAASSPFQYFTDHDAELGRLVTEGRRNEFSRFAAFADEDARARIPDPQARSTFEASTLAWDERGQQPHAGVERLYRALLALRLRLPNDRVEVAALDADTIGLLRVGPSGRAVLLVARLRGAGDQSLAAWGAVDARGGGWRVVLSTEDEGFAADPMPIEADLDRPSPHLRFARPSALVLETP